MTKLMEVTGSSAQGVTNLLWTTYNPSTLWIPFASVGLASAVGMLFYAKWVKKFEASDI